MAKEPKHFSYIVTPQTGDVLYWRPKQPSADLEMAMVPASQRGGIIGEFQSMGPKPQYYAQLFIPWHHIVSVEAKSSYEARVAASK